MNELQVYGVVGENPTMGNTTNNTYSTYILEINQFHPSIDCNNEDEVK